ncbi:MAG: hypothetical protein DWQ36_05845 [Acidobacteria bacterium]|nr:MAG: hypothetical protein DWQ30_08675 [Acidobacteriota bacterium]REK09780.1 MAG: hypothetical protein DWQ36_05845 [Acidobacteriota bacterium]
MLSTSWALTLALLCCGAALAHGQDEYSLATGFLYEGRLERGGAPAQGPHDLLFDLYLAAGDASTHAGFLGREVRPAVAVRDGRFQVRLDYGLDVFADDAPWIEVWVRPAGGRDDYIALPRRPLRGVGEVCIVDSSVTIDGTLTIDPPGTATDLTAACCNDVAAGGQLLLNGFLGALRADANEIQTTVLGAPGTLTVNANGGQVGIGVGSTTAPLTLPGAPDITASGGGALRIGSSSGFELSIDDNEIQARSNGTPSRLELNPVGGRVWVGRDLDFAIEQVSHAAATSSVFVNCPTGKRILSGGCLTDSSPTVDIEASFPFDEDTWACRFEQGAAGNTAFAVCANVEWED